MSAGTTTRALLDALRAVDREHACPAPLYVFDEIGHVDIIRCTRCRSTIWRDD